MLTECSRLGKTFAAHFSLALQQQPTTCWIASLCVVANALPLADWKAAIFLLSRPAKASGSERNYSYTTSAFSNHRLKDSSIFIIVEYRLRFLWLCAMCSRVYTSSAHFTTTSSAPKA